MTADKDMDLPRKAVLPLLDMGSLQNGTLSGRRKFQVRPLPLMSLSSGNDSKIVSASGMKGDEADCGTGCSTPATSRQVNNSDTRIVLTSSLSYFHTMYELDIVLGNGAMSIVRVGVRRSDGQRMAVKCICTEDEELRRATRTECDLALIAQHPNVVYVEGFYESPSEMWICMELCEDGSVDSFVRSFGMLRATHCKDLSQQLFEGVNYLHLKRIVHRDLKPANLLLHKNASVLKIADFNVAKQIGSGRCIMLTDRGTHLYSAPELRFGRVWNERVDIWACGLCIYFMLRARLPFDILHRHAARVIRSGWLPVVAWGTITDLMKNVIQQCLTIDFCDRPPAMELLLHPLFTGDGSMLQIKANSPHAGIRMPIDEFNPIFVFNPACGLLAGSPHKIEVASNCSESSFVPPPFRRAKTYSLDSSDITSPNEPLSPPDETATPTSPEDWRERRSGQDMLQRLAANRCERTRREWTGSRVTSPTYIDNKKPQKEAECSSPKVHRNALRIGTLRRHFTTHGAVQPFADPAAAGHGDGDLLTPGPTKASRFRLHSDLTGETPVQTPTGIVQTSHSFPAQSRR